MNVYVRELAHSLGDLCVKVDIFTRNHAGASHTIENISSNVRVVHLPGGPPDAPMDSYYGHLREFLDALSSFQQDNNLDYQLTHSHYWLSGWAGQAFAAQRQIPHVMTFHTLALIKMQSRAGETEPEQRSQSERDLMASSQRIIAFSSHERDAMVRLYDADARQISLAPCGVDLSLFRPLDQQQVRKRLGLNGEKVFLYVGRLEPLKGMELLLHTAAQMDSCDEMRVLVVGGDANGGQEVDRLKNIAKKLNVEDMFDFVGRVDQEELPLYYNAADVCVVPSYYESFGLAALESMACGTPVVAARVGGLSTIVQHGRTGFLKSWRCPEAFANSLEMIISSDRLKQSMGLASRRRAEGMGWDQVASDIRSLYESLTVEATKDDDD
ncbi:MAG TPA: glycosyltransferase family 1 protein [Dehalococcoidia bacterium]|nr:glycosyltransferase family 1 protein [Dehalococcoidia bacterium]